MHFERSKAKCGVSWDAGMETNQAAYHSNIDKASHTCRSWAPAPRTRHRNAATFP